MHVSSTREREKDEREESKRIEIEDGKKRWRHITERERGEAVTSRESWTAGQERSIGGGE